MADRTQEARERILNEAFEAPSPLAHLADRVSTLETALREIRDYAEPRQGMHMYVETIYLIAEDALAEGDNRP